MAPANGRFFGVQNERLKIGIRLGTNKTGCPLEGSKEPWDLTATGLDLSALAFWDIKLGFPLSFQKVIHFLQGGEQQARGAFCPGHFAARWSPELRSPSCSHC